MSHGVFVANSSPLIAFERLGKLALLQRLTSILNIPSAVRREVFGPRDLPAWIVERPISSLIPRTALAPRLGLGESEAIALAFELVPCHLLIDDRRRVLLSRPATVDGPRSPVRPSSRAQRRQA